VFTHVKVTTDADNFVATLQFSSRGQQSWTDGRNKYSILNRFRHLTDEVVENADVNATFSLFDTRGKMLGGCVRTRTALEATCK
jgi:hypothetical protein